MKFKHKNILRLMILLLTIMVATGLLSGCKKKAKEPEGTQQTEEAETLEEQQSEETESAVEDDQESKDEEEAAPGEAITESEEEELLDEEGYYYTKDEVALYIQIYGHLPDNYMTKKEAKNLGWSGGSLEKFAPGKVIGGDKFGNYEGILPEGKKYTECDIDTYKKKKRGAKRIIFSDDGYIYYTEDHYESFELLYEPD